MNKENLFSSISMPKKRERFEEGKRLDAYTYKKLFQIAGKKMKEMSHGCDHITTSVASMKVDGTIVMKSCSDSKHEKKHRVALDSKEVCFDNQESAKEHPQMDCDENDTTLKTGPTPTHSAELAEFQLKVSSEVHDHVNKLCDYWKKGQNSVFFDGQDRIIKVVFFVLSLLEKVKQPILILTASRCLSLWESEFSKWSNSTNVVITYKENKDVKDAIRSSQLYTENGSLKFQVILSSPDAIVEDFEKLDHIKWGLIVIDECQRPIISKHFKEIKLLVSDMKLLTITSEILDVKHSYQNFLSLLDSKYEETHTDADMDANTLKEKLSPFIAFELKFNSSEIEEYWVPVHLSHMQIEQYSSLLNSNFESLSLSSSSRNNATLHDILTKTQKCCDHPYLVDPTLRKSLKKDVDKLGAEINASGKLQLLDKLLLKIKRYGLRVIVLFQSVVSSEKITIGDILEDLVDRRFGQDSYVRIQPKILSMSKRKEAVNMFNNIKSGAFVCLLDYHDCQSTIRLSSVDIVILFNSDWNPSDDLKALHKLSLDSSHLRIFRFYSSFTIEEKSLILSKQGTILDSRTARINYNTCHRLLSWGASYLFNNLSTESNSKSKSNSDTSLDDLVLELSSMFLNKTENTDRLKSLIISKALIHDGVYSKDILLMGETEAHTNESCSIEEYLMENEPNNFWSNLFKESHRIHTPQKSSSRLPRRVKMSFRNPYYWFGRFEVESESDTENTEKNVISSTFVRTKMRSKRKARKMTGASKHFFIQHSTQSPNSIPSFSSTNNVGGSPNNQPPQPQTLPMIPSVSDQNSITTPLETELQNIKKEQEQVTKLHQEKKSMLNSECEKEMLEIRKKYDGLIDESEMCLTKKMKVLEGYYDLVYANKVLAETLTKDCDDYLNKEMRGVKIVEIPASTLVQSQNRCTTSGHTLRAPAPHLRSNPSLFASFQRMPVLGSN
ncbi:hypothetical protein Lser_V15G02068 [Lactuca serriola]